VPGDELRLRYPGDSSHPTWQSVGHVVIRNMLIIYKLGQLDLCACAKYIVLSD
jgi:hypothetical protein